MTVSTIVARAPSARDVISGLDELLPKLPKGISSLRPLQSRDATHSASNTPCLIECSAFDHSSSVKPSTNFKLCTLIRAAAEHPVFPFFDGSATAFSCTLMWLPFPHAYNPAPAN